MRTLVERASAMLGRANGDLNIMIACRRLSRTRVREAAALARTAAEMLESLAGEDSSSGREQSVVE